MSYRCIIGKGHTDYKEILSLCDVLPVLENPFIRFRAFIIFMTVTYYFEPYMAPIGLLLFFLKHFLVNRYLGQKQTAVTETVLNVSDEEEDPEDKEEDKEEKKSIKEKLQAIQEVSFMVQNGLGYAAHFCEAVKNTFNFSVPFLSLIALVSLLLISLVLALFDLRTIIIVVGSVKFIKNLIVPGWESNNELLDFLSRVPDDRLLEETRELPGGQ